MHLLHLFIIYLFHSSFEHIDALGIFRLIAIVGMICALCSSNRRNSAIWDGSSECVRLCVKLSC